MVDVAGVLIQTPRSRRAPRAALATLAGITFLGVGCGAESYRRGPSDAARDLAPDDPGTGGAVGAGGGGGTDASEDATGMGGGGGDLCTVQGSNGVDAAVPTFAMSWTFDGPGGLLRWSPIGQPAMVVATTMAVLDPQDGFPDPGSVRMTIPFAGAGQQVALGFAFSAPQDFAGKLLSARVRLNSCNPSGAILAGLAFKSVASAYVFASSAVPTIVAANSWTTFSLSFDAPDGFVDLSHKDADGGTIYPDPRAVLEIDVLVLTGSSPFTTADVSIDTIGISDIP